MPSWVRSNHDRHTRVLSGCRAGAAHPASAPAYGRRAEPGSPSAMPGAGYNNLPLPRGEGRGE
ncbi:MAG: hypothetical protein ACK55I_27730, partial [bacterium]